MSIYNEYLTGFEREIAIQEAKVETEFSKYFTMLEMVELQYDQMVRDAELKVLTESGTYDDLAYLISEAENEVVQQKKGIFATIIGAIANLFKTIGEKLRNLFNIKDDKIDVNNVVVEADSNVVEKHKAFVTCFNNISEGINKIKNGETGGLEQFFKGISIPVITVGGAAGGAALLKKYRAGDLKNIAKTVDDLRAKALAFLERVEAETRDGKTFMDKLKHGLAKTGLYLLKDLALEMSKFSSVISKWVTDAIAAAKKVGGNIVNKIKGNNEEAQGEPDDNNADQQNQDQNGSSGKGDKVEPIAKKIDNKGNKYRLYPDGTWKKLAKGSKNWVDVPTVPKFLQHITPETVAKESTVDKLQALVGSYFIVEKVDDGFIFTETSDSISSSIFSNDYENDESIQESVDAFDEELDELSRLFEGL